MHRVVRIENRMLYEEYRRERSKIAERLAIHDEHNRKQIQMLDQCTPQWLRESIGAAVGGGLQHDMTKLENNSRELNELYLWHGLPATLTLEGKEFETWRLIAEHGFDERVGGDTNGKLYGSGCYFADASSKSNQYSKTTVNADGHHCMLRCRVIMGDPFMVKKPYSGRRPPLNPRTPGLPYDSIFAQEGVTKHGLASNGNAGKQFHNEYVIFNKRQVYPEYAVWYTLE